MDYIIGHYNYWIAIFLMMVGFYTVISRGNLVKKIIGLNIFQVSVFLLYISMSTVKGGAAPIITEGIELYSNPLPPCIDPYSDCCRRRHNRAWAGAGYPD